MNLFRGAGEVGMDLEALEVADDKQGRILEVVTVEQKLDVGAPEVAGLALVLPGEVAALPDVGEALTPGSLGDMPLEGVEGAIRIDV